ncbi:AAA family ATPase [archaeon]|nr:MAG: AAA family ATPase [archaeon]
MDRRIIAQLYDCIDQLISLNKQAFTIKETEIEDNKEEAGSAKNSQVELYLPLFPLQPLQPASDSSDLVKMTQKMVFLVVATSKPDGIDGGVRGRFSREIPLPVPDANARSKIIALHCQYMRLDSSVDFKELGKMTPGYVGADLVGLGREAGMVAVSRIIQNMKDSASQTPDITPLSMEVEGEAKVQDNSQQTSFIPLPLSYSVEMSDFQLAMKNIVPAGKREGFVMTADVTWGDIGALAEVREELTQQLLEPIAHPERFRALGLELPAGVLFYGPPGCGKTLLAKALANQSGANFISVKGPELLNMYVGESESRVRQVFARARASAPCMIFFDELDALVPKRSSGWGGGEGSSNGVAERVVNQLLTELDGLESRKDVYIIGATNRLELIDEAMLRPGRLGNLLYVPLPTASERVSILNALVRKVSVGETVNMEKVAYDSRCEGFSGADCSALVREAGLAVIKEISSLGGLDKPACKDECVKIEGRHFERALQKVRPSVAPLDRKRYTH